MTSPGRAQRIVIIGAGFGGVAAAVELRQHGFDDITILEAGPAIGGTWLHNTYPGVACDVPSPLYSFSFAQRDNWKHLCAQGSDILAYLQSVAREQGVDRLVSTGTKVTAADWDADTATWRVTAHDGRSWVADALLVATGQLNQPRTAPVPGLESFAGHIFHSARWDHSHDLTGRRVSVIGNGASAVQFVPAIAPRTAHLNVFQRSANWFLPRRNSPYPRFIRDGVQRIPGVQEFRRNFLFHYGESLTMAIRHPDSLGAALAARSRAFMRRQLRHATPELLADAMPDYPFGCKRVLFSSYFLPTLTRPDVSLLTDRIVEAEPGGLRTADGRLHRCDTLIWATGFASNDFMFPMAITGRGGLTLREAWKDGAHAHLGMTVPGFPSMFVLYGPNTNTSGGSIIWYLEQQVRYVRQAMELLRRHGAAALDVRPSVEAASDAALQAKFANTAWTGGCDSWYLDRGRNVANWPGYMAQYRKAVKTLDPTEFELITQPA
jgi:cation diffusion facilitator CzcD-associated flavoprotein CzcO